MSPPETLVHSPDVVTGPHFSLFRCTTMSLYVVVVMQNNSAAGTWFHSHFFPTLATVMVRLSAIGNDKGKPKQWPKEQEQKNNRNEGSRPNHFTRSGLGLSLAVWTSEFDRLSTL